MMNHESSLQQVHNRECLEKIIYNMLDCNGHFSWPCIVQAYINCFGTLRVSKDFQLEAKVSEAVEISLVHVTLNVSVVTL